MSVVPSISRVEAGSLAHRPGHTVVFDVSSPTVLCHGSCLMACLVLLDVPSSLVLPHASVHELALVLAACSTVLCLVALPLSARGSNWRHVLLPLPFMATGGVRVSYSLLL